MVLGDAVGWPDQLRAGGFVVWLSDGLAADEELTGAVFEKQLDLPAFSLRDRRQRSFVDEQPVEPGAALATIFILV